MGRLERFKLIAEIANLTAYTGATVWDRIKSIQSLNEKVAELEKQVKELKEKK